MKKGRDHLVDLNEVSIPKKTSKNIIICLDGTDNQFGGDQSNIIKLFRMLERDPDKQVTYYDPGVGTMGDQTYKSKIARMITKVLGLAFGRGLMKNLIEAYSFLMEEYNDGDKVFIFGFSRGAYTARALAGFIKECGLLERSAKNLLPYAKRNFLKKAPKGNKEEIDKFHRERSGFRKVYGRLLNHGEDPLYPGEKREPNNQLRIHFLGLFDTVKSYGGIRKLVLRNEKDNPSVLNIRHALAIDEKRIFFPQMHWKASKGKQKCKEVWFAGDHSDVGGGHPESQSGLAKISLEWMVHEAIDKGMKVDRERYGLPLQRTLNKDNTWTPFTVKKEDIGKYSAPNSLADAHDESLKLGWKLLHLFSKMFNPWGVNNGMRTIIKKEGLGTAEKHNPFLVHQSVLDRIKKKDGYNPENLKSLLKNLTPENIEQTKLTKQIFKSKRT